MSASPKNVSVSLKSASASGSVRRLIEPNRRILIVDDNKSIHEDFVKPQPCPGYCFDSRCDIGHDVVPQAIGHLLLSIRAIRDNPG